MIVDVHTHIYESGSGGPFNLPARAEDLVRGMDAAGIDAAVVLPLPGVASNEFVQRECSRFPGRLYGLYYPEFDCPEETIARMEGFFEHHEPRGLKIHPRVQNVTVEDRVVVDVLGWADKRGLPVLFDVFPYGENLDDMRLHPLAYHRVAQTIPGLKIILAHSGGHKAMEAFLVAKANGNVFLDISFTPVYFRGASIAQDVFFLSRRLPPGRVLYGSDFPYVRLAESLDTARAGLGDLDPAARDAVLGTAAQTLFRLGQ